MAIAIALIVLAGGSVLFYFLSPWHLTPLASNWGAIDVTIAISFWVTGLVFLAVSLFIAVALIRFRHRRRGRAHYRPENKPLEFWLTAATTLGIGALLAPGLVVWGHFVTVPDDAHEVEVVGQQWHWSFRFPGKDGVFGEARNALIDEANPLGLAPGDPAGRDDVLVEWPILTLPEGRPVKVLLRSKDVLHNFKVPPFRAKMDAIPGQVSYFWFTPTRIGDFEAVCAELCGIGHFAMRARVRVVEPARFEAWLAEQPTHAERLARPPGDPQAGEQHYAACTACHGEKGQGRQATGAPRLAGLGTDYLVRQLRNFRVGARGTHEQDVQGRQMRPFARSLAGEAAMRDLAAHIATLPMGPSPLTVEGDPRQGRRLYRSCANCHGTEGQGDPRYKAPRLAGMNDWYLVRQLEHFRAGIRGRHPRDPYGNQMVDMAQVLVDEAAVRDVVAYINGLARADAAQAVARQAEE
ncbi:c-type cytochrome [Halomonas organivorans]